ncbi:hypothetical protein CPB84DRAFT_142000 [Gymnopilus junonius]|uniref:MYND-type domain-containing protein n=1 Tax=Gymnopilus junonius TaxID=109634 RepID=A0A9P5TIK1_GYMJU|nr:hypothetical protein CPB84DRAFT_142000 [Gymnopilus junonius]
MKSLGKLTNDARCEVCGKKTTSRCSQCLSAVYCSKECQENESPDAAIITSWKNRLDPQQNTSVDIPPPKTQLGVCYGKPFLAKFQIALTGNIQPPHMLVYDRRRSFRLFWRREFDPSLFEEAARIIGNKFKFYRWMKRTGEYEFQFCLERAPEQDPVW